MQFSIPGFRVMGKAMRYVLDIGQQIWVSYVYLELNDWLGPTQNPLGSMLFSIPGFGTFGISTEVLNIALDYDDSVNHTDIKLMMIQ